MHFTADGRPGRRCAGALDGVASSRHRQRAGRSRSGRADPARRRPRRPAAPPRWSRPTGCSRAASPSGSKPGASASTIPPAGRSPRRCPAPSSISSSTRSPSDFAPAAADGAAEASADAARPVGVRRAPRCAGAGDRSLPHALSRTRPRRHRRGAGTGRRARSPAAAVADRAVQRLWTEDWHAARDLVARLRKAFAPLTGSVRHRGEQPLQAISSAPMSTAAEAIVERCPSEADRGRPSCGGAKPDTAASTFLTGLLDAATAGAARSPPPTIPISIAACIVGENVRPRVAGASAAVHLGAVRGAPAAARRRHPRLAQRRHLAGGRRSRAVAQPADAQGAGPADARRRRSATRRTTSRRCSAAAGSISRAPQKIDGVPTVPSRWLMRLAGAARWARRCATRCSPTQPWLGWAQSRDAMPQRIRSIRAPEPRPPVALRPRKLSVTRRRDAGWRIRMRSSPRDILKLDAVAGARRDAGRGAARQRRARGARPLRAAPSDRPAGRHRTAS